MKPTIFAAINKNDEVRGKSSSGGIFFELASAVILQNGVVFGAAFDSEWNVIHTCRDTFDGIRDFMGSKYVQSSIGDSYKSAKNYLDEGVLVLFSGTPCQIGGLKAFLGKDYQNLITVDFICHGVPSRGVWRKYLSEIAGGREITSVNFRDKSESWTGYTLTVVFSDGTVYRKTSDNDLYMKGFLQNIILRPSCYECGFKGVERAADITIGDFWGADKEFPEIFDNKGMSAVMLNSEQGIGVWESISDKFLLRETNAETIITYNKNMVKSSPYNVKREEFFGGELSLEKLKKLTKVPLEKRVLRKLKRIVKKIIGK